MRFLADMGISPRTVAFLCGLGHEAIHLHEEGLDRLPDPAILAKARQEGRVVLTHDLDFSELVAVSSARLPSVVVFRLRNMHPSNVNSRLLVLIEERAKDLAGGAIISVTEAGFRVRVLPVEK